MNELVSIYPGKELHVVLDNLYTHKPKEDRWLKTHPNVMSLKSVIITWFLHARKMAHPILQLEATEEEILELGRLVRGGKVPVRDRFRARTILLRLEGRSETEIAMVLGCSLGAVCKWSKRFDSHGIAGLEDARGRGRKALLSAEKISLVVERATRPAQGRIRWSVRSMAREAAVSKSTVQRI